MLHSSYNKLEVVARIEDNLHHFYLERNGWKGPFEIPNSSGSAGSPSFIQNPGPAQNFEVVVPRAAAGLMHFTRANSEP
jgi:hypothetical protein